MMHNRTTYIVLIGKISKSIETKLTQVQQRIVKATTEIRNWVGPTHLVLDNVQTRAKESIQKLDERQKRLSTRRLIMKRETWESKNKKILEQKEKYSKKHTELEKKVREVMERERWAEKDDPIRKEKAELEEMLKGKQGDLQYEDYMQEKNKHPLGEWNTEDAEREVRIEVYEEDIEDMEKRIAELDGIVLTKTVFDANLFDMKLKAEWE
jgi:hypothetical protein